MNDFDSVSVEDLEVRLDAANKTLARAQSEVQRLNRVQGDLQSQLSDLARRIKAARSNAYRNISEERQINAVQAFEEAARLRAEHSDLTNALAFVSSFSYEQACLDLLLAEIEERTATGLLLSAQALTARKALLSGIGAVASQDPGITVSFKDARSQLLLEQSENIFNQIATMEEKLAAKRKSVAAEQSLVGVKVFSN